MDAAEPTRMARTSCPRCRRETEQEWQYVRANGCRHAHAVGVVCHCLACGRVHQPDGLADLFHPFVSASA